MTAPINSQPPSLQSLSINTDKLAQDMQRLHQQENATTPESNQPPAKDTVTLKKDRSQKKTTESPKESPNKLTSFAFSPLGRLLSSIGLGAGVGTFIGATKSGYEDIPHKQTVKIGGKTYVQTDPNTIEMKQESLLPQFPSIEHAKIVDGNHVSTQSTRDSNFMGEAGTFNAEAHFSPDGKIIKSSIEHDGTQIFIAPAKNSKTNYQLFTQLKDGSVHTLSEADWDAELIEGTFINPALKYSGHVQATEKHLLALPSHAKEELKPLLQVQSQSNRATKLPFYLKAMDPFTNGMEGIRELGKADRTHTILGMMMAGGLIAGVGTFLINKLLKARQKNPSS